MRVLEGVGEGSSGEERVKWIKRVLLVLSVLLILYFTIFTRDFGATRIIKGPFWELSNHYWKSISENIVLFIPFGFACKFNEMKVWKTLVLGCLFSALVEFVQYIAALGYSEADDVINNVIGTALGVLIFIVSANLTKMLRRKCKGQGWHMYEKYVKRLTDIILSIITLPFFFIIFIFVAPFILLDDGRPVFYNADRIGRGGKLFKMYKFRSMMNNAPDIRLADNSTYNGDDDPRVTKVGKILRKTSIDEVPQVLNILKGDMSLIGPRPDTPKGAHVYPEEEKYYLRVRPGITGYSQAYFRNSIDGKQKAINDMYYAQHVSFVFDVKIFFKTIATVLLREGTYKEDEHLEGVEELKKAMEKAGKK